VLALDPNILHLGRHLYLRATSGNDRFYPVELVRVDVEEIKRDRDQLIGEAVDLLRDEMKHGHKWWELSDEARPQPEEKRSEAEVAHPWHGTIAKAVEGLDEVCAGIRISRHRQGAA
jgi:predicted P-loop ATPase